MAKLETMAKTLGITVDEAKALIEADKEIDRMNTNKEINADLTDEQQKESKGARQSERAKKPAVYKFDNTKSKKKEKPTNKKLINDFKALVEDLGAVNVEIINDQREFTFTIDGTKFKVVLSNPRT